MPKLTLRPWLTLVVLVAAGGSAPAAKEARLDGTWSSPSCGSRKYERRITFVAAGTFTAEDRVAPCPEGVACVWSGIVTRRGTFKRKGARVLLTVENDQAPRAEPLPASLSFRRGQLAEPAPGGGCVYQRFVPSR